MLSHRIFASLVLIPLVIVFIFFLPINWFGLVMLLIIGIAGFEWAQFLSITSTNKRVLIGLLYAILSYVCIVLVDYNVQFGSVLLLATISILWWLSVLVLVLKFPSIHNLWGKSPCIKFLFGVLTLVPFFIAMFSLRCYASEENIYFGGFLVLYVLGLVWATDTGAYFCGRKFGKRKLAPKVSPGKTIEGMAGGVAQAFIVSLIVYSFHFPVFAQFSSSTFIISSILAVLFSVLGDLSESMFKRDSNIKDSGNLIPGHGGILDRIDSLTAAFPIFFAALLFLN